MTFAFLVQPFTNRAKENSFSQFLLNILSFNSALFCSGYNTKKFDCVVSIYVLCSHFIASKLRAVAI